MTRLLALARATKKKVFVPGLLLGILIFLCLVQSRQSERSAQLLWRIPIPWLSASSLAADNDGTVYALTYSSDLVSIDARGKKRWSYSVAGTSLSPPTIGPDGTIYTCACFRTGTNSGLVALRRDGSIRWSFDVQTTASSSLALDAGSTLYVNGRDRALWAFTAEGTERWRFQTDGELYSAPILAPDGRVLIYPADSSNNIVCLDTNGVVNYTCAGNRLRSFGGCFDAVGTFYLSGGSNETIRAINQEGSTRWVLSTPEAALAASVLDEDGNLYFVGLDQQQRFELIALDKKRSIRWRVPLGSCHSLGSPILAEDGVIYVASGDPKVTAIRPNGTIKWVFRPSRPYGGLLKNWSRLPDAIKQALRKNVLVTPPVLAPTGVLYVGFGQPYSSLYALDAGAGPARKSPWPMAGGNPRRTRGVAE